MGSAVPCLLAHLQGARHAGHHHLASPVAAAGHRCGQGAFRPPADLVGGGPGGYPGTVLQPLGPAAQRHAPVCRRAAMADGRWQKGLRRLSVHGLERSGAQAVHPGRGAGFQRRSCAGSPLCRPARRSPDDRAAGPADAARPVGRYPAGALSAGAGRLLERRECTGQQSLWPAQCAAGADAHRGPRTVPRLPHGRPAEARPETGRPWPARREQGSVGRLLPGSVAGAAGSSLGA